MDYLIRCQANSRENLDRSPNHDEYGERRRDLLGYVLTSRYRAKIPTLHKRVILI